MLTSLKENHFVRNEKLPIRAATEREVSINYLQKRSRAREILKELASKLDRPKLVSSAYGEITNILLTMPDWLFNDPPAKRDPYKNAYTKLLSSLPADLEFTILTHDSTLDECKNWVSGLGRSHKTVIGTADPSLNFSIWAQDAYCISDDLHDSEKYFVESASFRRYADEFIADEVAEFTPLKLALSNLYFQGGNILVGDETWLIGLDYPNNSFEIGSITQRPDETKLEAIRRAYSLEMERDRILYPIGTHLPVPEEQKVPQSINGDLWHHVVYRGNQRGTAQPLFHIDMFITLLGKNSKGQEIALVGDPSEAEKMLSRFDYIQFAKGYSMQGVFNDIARRLRRIGFEVIRNPLPSAYYVDAKKKEILWYFATSNNALVQVNGNKRDIWMPEYGFGSFQELNATDQRNREILEAQGFTVHGLGDFHPFAGGLGAVHCITKYLGRKINGGLIA
ncbi:MULTISPECIES: hypothetical protein [Rhodomicrobium]|uniref:hypothetical protein n=1 Tax=Rhodomicrobium TaxID=1068 RepID=UPI000F73CDF2|nr:MULTISPECIES: hypothetical protein [Rhodomicrobium]